MITIKKFEFHSTEEITELYSSVGWTAYTDEPDILIRGIENSLLTLAAYDGSRLAGLIRAVGDSFTVVFIQDILVRPEYQRKGIGKTLMKAVLKKFGNVRQIELITDAASGAAEFYRAMGFSENSELGCCGFIYNPRQAPGL